VGERRQLHGGGSGLARALLIVLAAALPLLLSPFEALATYDSLEEIPVESRLYGDLESLAVRYGSGRYFLNRRPWTRGEARAFLDDLGLRVHGSSSDPSYIRVEREVSPEGRGATKPLWSRAEEAASVQISPYATFAYSEDRAVRPIVSRDFRIGLQSSVRAASNLLLFGDWYAGTFSPGGHGTPSFGTNSALVEGVDFHAWLDRAYVALEKGVHPHRFRATLSHSWVRWGPGATGTLAVSDAAPALDRLGFDLGLLRGVETSWFVASLDAPQQAFYAAHRLGIRLGDRLELAFAEEVRFDGIGQVLYHLIPTFPYILIEKRVGVFTTTADTTSKFTKNNVMNSGEFTLTIAPGLRWYGELLVDDLSFSSAFKPWQIGWQTGLHAAKAIDTDRILTIRGEYTRIYNFVYSVWHHHDFSLGGLPLGYPLGPDAEQAWGNVVLDWRAAWKFDLAGSWVRKGEGRLGAPWLIGTGKVDNVPLSGTVERTWRGVVGIEFGPSAGLSIEGKLGYTSVMNAEHVAGRGRSDFTGAVGIRARR
jgi:hypothetical protein